MKRAVFLLVVLPAVVCACKPVAQEAEAPPEKPVTNLEFDVPGDEGAQLVNVITRDIPPGGEVPWHTHPGVEIAYVESGELELRMQGKGPERLRAGDSFMAPRGVVHGGSNVGTTSARLVITYVVDKGAPLRSPAEAPED